MKAAAGAGNRKGIGMERRGFLQIIAFGVAGTGLAACGGSGGPSAGGDASGPGVLSVARSNGMGRFARAAQEADMGEYLSGAGPFTLFAPSDRAFAASSAGRMSGEDLQRLVAYHVVPGTLTSEFLIGMDVNHTTLLNSSLNVDGTGGALTVNGARVLRADLEAANGIVFQIDRVLTPR